MQFTAKELAKIIDGTIIGNPETVISGFSKIEAALPNTLCFVGSPKYTKYIMTSQAAIIIICKDLVPKEPVDNIALIAVDDAHQAFVELMRIYTELTTPKEPVGISEHAVVDDKAVIGENCYIGATTVIMQNVVIGKQNKIHPQVYIGNNVKIGDNNVIYPGVKIYDNCKIGNNCIIHAGTIIGTDGFGFTQENGISIKVPQLGNVVIGNDIEIGANCTIDKATLGSTIIHDGVKLDNLIHIAHNCEICDNTLITSLTGIAGSTVIGKNCMIGGQVGIIDHIAIGNNVRIVAQSGIMHDVKDNATIMGAPAFNFSDYMRSYACFRNLPQKLKQLENETKNSK